MKKKYLKEFLDIMKKEDLYVLGLSPLTDNNVTFINLRINDIKISDIKDLIIVKTGESPEYVREIITNKKIPVIYNRVYKLPNRSFPKLVQPFSIKEYCYKDTIYNYKYDYIAKIFKTTNFLEFNCLTSMSVDYNQFEKILMNYKKMHFDVDDYRRKLDGIEKESNDRYLREKYSEYYEKKIVGYTKEKMITENSELDIIIKELRCKNEKLHEMEDCPICKGRKMIPNNIYDDDELDPNIENYYISFLDNECEYSLKYKICPNCLGIGKLYVYSIDEIDSSLELANSCDGKAKKEKNKIKLKSTKIS